MYRQWKYGLKTTSMKIFGRLIPFCHFFSCCSIAAICHDSHESRGRKSSIFYSIALLWLPIWQPSGAVILAVATKIKNEQYAVGIRRGHNKMGNQRINTTDWPIAEGQEPLVATGFFRLTFFYLLPLKIILLRWTLLWEVQTSNLSYKECIFKILFSFLGIWIGWAQLSSLLWVIPISLYYKYQKLTFPSPRQRKYEINRTC